MAEKKKNNQDYVGRDRIISGGAGSVIIGGDATNNMIITGNNNQANATHNAFQPIYRAVEESKLPVADKQDITAEVKDLEDEVKKGEEADEGFLARRLRNIQRMSTDILDVALTTLSSPVAGLSMVAKKVAEKMKAEATPSTK